MQAPGFWWRKSGAATALMSPLAALYGFFAKRRLAQSGVHIGVPVICGGNPTVGGAGKTPTAIAVARFLISAGERPAFLTRGFGGRLAGPVLVETSHGADDVGDEPLLLARVAPTIVSRDRVVGARRAIAAGASVSVMDDGFQNPSLAAAGINAQIQRGFADHHRYRATEAAALLAEAERRDLALVTTEKDLARLQGDPALAALAARVHALPVELIVREQDDFRRLVRRAIQRA